jgi:ubiquitin fusion degradation protein 1
MILFGSIEMNSPDFLKLGFPYIFELSNNNREHPKSGIITHCGVLEFTADEGCCYVPSWVLKQLGLNEGGLINVKSVASGLIPKGNKVKLQAESKEFLRVPDPKALLESELKKYMVLTKGDNVPLVYKNHRFWIEIITVD